MLVGDAIGCCSIHLEQGLSQFLLQTGSVILAEELHACCCIKSEILNLIGGETHYHTAQHIVLLVRTCCVCSPIVIQLVLVVTLHKEVHPVIKTVIILQGCSVRVVTALPVFQVKILILFSLSIEAFQSEI